LATVRNTASFRLAGIFRVVDLVYPILE
jgi:hypothetical protein